VNPTGRFVIGGRRRYLQSDKPQDYYRHHGGAAPHGGGAFSAGSVKVAVPQLMATVFAKNIVAAWPQSLIGSAIGVASHQRVGDRGTGSFG
jgi:S-adenosylmethionine synthetase